MSAIVPEASLADGFLSFTSHSFIFEVLELVVNDGLSDNSSDNETNRSDVFDSHQSSLKNYRVLECIIKWN